MRDLRRQTLNFRKKEKLLPSDMYESCTNVTDVEALNDACAEIAELWEKEVLPLVQ